MIDPVTAFAATQAAYRTVKTMISMGQDFSHVANAMGKYYTGVGDLRKAQHTKPPLFKQLFSAASVEEEALDLMIKDKTLQEQEAELTQLLNFRYGWGTMDELKEMRRKIKKEREETIFKQHERQRAFFDLVFGVLGAALICGLIGGIIYFVGSVKGMW
tara:strand:- start:616 stop:1092 length:477 start_codon:yes stop_codon:yes gene_type:complete